MKKLLSLILALAVCFSLAACGNDASSYDDDDDDNEEELVEMRGEARLYRKYADIIGALENKEYQEAIRQINIMLIEEQKANQEPLPAIADVLCDNVWHARVTEDTTVAPIMRFSQDGTCQLGDQSLNWIEQNSDEEYMSIFILSEGEYVYCASLQSYANSGPLLYLYTCGQNEYGYYSDKQLATYYPNPMIPVLRTGWQQAGMTDTLPNSFWFYDYTFNIDNHSYRWSVTDTAEGDLMTVAAVSREGDSTREFTAHLQDRNGIYVVVLSENGTDNEATYYNEEYGYSADWTESLYGQARRYLKSYLGNSSRTIYVDNKSLTPNQSRALIYDLFNRASGYRDADAYLARFTILPSDLVKLTETTVDQLDKSQISTKGEYYYNPDGTLAKARGTGIIDAYGMYYTDYQHFVYDESGKISQIIGGYNIDNPGAIGTPEYDDKGNMVALKVQTGSGSYTSTFTYDDQGRILTADIYPGNYNGRNITYTYGEDGKLVKKVLVRDNGYYTYTYDYTYTGDALTHIKETYTYRYGGGYETEYAITCDDQNRPLSVAVTTTDSNNTYKSTTQNYHYEDLYFMQIDDLLEEKD